MARWPRWTHLGRMNNRTHRKLMIVDGLLVSVGSTNFDNRSFRLNDEATLNVVDKAFASACVKRWLPCCARSCEAPGPHARGPGGRGNVRFRTDATGAGEEHGPPREPLRSRAMGMSSDARATHSLHEPTNRGTA